MKKTSLILSLVFLLFSGDLCYAKQVKVKGYYRKDGTYVRPHYRSAPDSVKWNNYGAASYQQRQQYKSYTVLPSYQNDYDSDGVLNRYDYDDNNNGVLDDDE